MTQPFGAREQSRIRQSAARHGGAAGSGGSGRYGAADGILGPDRRSPDLGRSPARVRSPAPCARSPVGLEVSLDDQLLVGPDHERP